MRFICHRRSAPTFTVLQPYVVSNYRSLLLSRKVLHCPMCTIMWSVPVCVCCTDAANVYRSGVWCGFRAGGHSLSLDLRVDTDTTRTRRQSVAPCNLLSHGTDREQGHTLETSHKLIGVFVLNDKNSQLTLNNLTVHISLMYYSKRKIW